MNFLGTPTLSRLGSSFLSSSLIRRHTPESLSSVVKPLIHKPEDEPHQRRSSHSLLPPIPSRRSSIKKDGKPVSHEFTISRESSYGQAVLNGKLMKKCYELWWLTCSRANTNLPCLRNGWLGFGYDHPLLSSMQDLSSHPASFYGSSCILRLV